MNLVVTVGSKKLVVVVPFITIANFLEQLLLSLFYRGGKIERF